MGQIRNCRTTEIISTNYTMILLNHMYMYIIVTFTIDARITMRNMHSGNINITIIDYKTNNDI